MNKRVRRGGLTRWGLATVIVAGALLLVSCGVVGTDGGSDEGSYGEPVPSDGIVGTTEEMARDSAIAPVPPPDQPGGSGVDASTVPPDERYIIRSVGVRVQVDDVEAAVKSVREEVEKVEGMVTSVQVSTDENLPVYRYEATGGLADGAPLQGYIVVRVPAESLDAFVDSVGALGTVQRQAEDESDVTQEHIDISARLKTLQAQEVRLREFFDQAENVEEMLAIEQELTRVRAEIESLTAQVAYLERQAAMATVAVELAGKPPVVSPNGTDWGIVDAIRQGIRGLVNTINALIVIALSALPLLAVIAVAVLAIRWLIRRQHRHDDLEAPPGDTSV
jgi:hypothetical protein